MQLKLLHLKPQLKFKSHADSIDTDTDTDPTTATATDTATDTNKIIISYTR